jgi:uncharacterized Zn finger protein (UPF0148 family)
MEQQMPCPVCRTPIFFNVYHLLQGERFVCPSCQAAITLSPESHDPVQNALDKLDKLKQLQQK